MARDLCKSLIFEDKNMNRKILFVDDDPNILQGYKRALRKEFDIHIAEGGREGLNILQAENDFAVIVSDMRMPGMDGIQFLKYVKKLAPDSVRMMLTGNADQQTAMDAVNEGSIFRFMTKPCEPETFAAALNAGIEQYRLITLEKHLLDETLNKSLQVMVEILSMVNTTAFSRSSRVKRLARDIADRVGIKNAWEVEIAAMLSQIGCITVPEETLLKISKCEPLNEAELFSYHQHPKVGHDLVVKIPRMENVAEIIANQNRRINDDTDGQLRTDLIDEKTRGARVLKAVLDFDKLLDAGNLPHNAFKELSLRVGWYDPVILNTLKELIDEGSEEFISTEIDVRELKPGMLLDQSIFTNKRILLLSEGQEITLPLIMRLINFSETGVISHLMKVKVPVSRFSIEDQPISIEQTMPPQDSGNLNLSAY